MAKKFLPKCIGYIDCSKVTLCDAPRGENVMHTKKEGILTKKSENSATVKVAKIRRTRYKKSVTCKSWNDKIPKHKIISETLYHCCCSPYLKLLNYVSLVLIMADFGGLATLSDSEQDKENNPAAKKNVGQCKVLTRRQMNTRFCNPQLIWPILHFLYGFHRKWILFALFLATIIFAEFSLFLYEFFLFCMN